MAQAQEKTEKPTSKKLEDARKRGHIAKSRELSSVAVVAGGGMGLYISTGLIRHNFRELLEELWGHGFSLGIHAGLFTIVLRHFAWMLLPTLLSAFVMAMGINMLQTKGLLFSLEAIQPSFSKLDPIQGLQRFASLRTLVELAKSLLKIAIIGDAVYTVCHSALSLCIRSTETGLPGILGIFSHLTVMVVVRASLVMLAMALLDLYYQQWQYQEDLKMTKQEVKEENKQTEGNPQIKARIRAIQRSLAQRRMMASVPKASVVITNPTHYAVALLYNRQMEAPRVVAKGMDFLAKKIIATARKHKIPVIENPPLARALYSEVKVDATIPVSLYKAVAKVLAYIYQQQGRKPV